LIVEPARKYMEKFTAFEAFSTFNSGNICIMLGDREVCRIYPTGNGEDFDAFFEKFGIVEIEDDYQAWRKKYAN